MGTYGHKWLYALLLVLTLRYFYSWQNGQWRAALS
jgi:hypothetical protein